MPASSLPIHRGSIRAVAAAVCWSAPAAAVGVGAVGGLLAAGTEDIDRSVRIAIGIGEVVTLLSATGFVAGLVALVVSRGTVGPFRRLAAGLLLAGIVANGWILGAFGPTTLCLLR